MKLLRSCKPNILQWRINPLNMPLWPCTWSSICGMRPRGLWPTAGRWDIPCAPGCSLLLPCDPGNFVPIFLAFVLLVSDAPFRNRQQQFVLLRVGKEPGSGGS